MKNTKYRIAITLTNEENDKTYSSISHFHQRDFKPTNWDYLAEELLISLLAIKKKIGRR